MAAVDILKPTEEDIRLLLATDAHIGTKNVNIQMHRYVWKRRSDGVHIIDLSKTWEKLILAARIIVAVENPADVAVLTSHKEGQRAVQKFANLTRATTISGRFTPGTFTNQSEQKFMEPRLLIVADPHLDNQPVTEAAYVNIPTIAFATTENSVRRVDCVIPINNKGKNSVALAFWLLAREVLRMRGQLSRREPWTDVPVDLFIYKPPEDYAASKDRREEAVAQPTQPALPYPTDDFRAEQGGLPDWQSGNTTTSWSDAPADNSAWSAETEGVPSGAAGVNVPLTHDAGVGAATWDQQSSVPANSIISGWDQRQ
jgi:small subunit ribosomal protein SAe